MNQDNNEVTLEIGEDAAVVDIRGDLTIATEPLLVEAYDDASGQGATRVLFKLEPDAHVDSGGIGVLLQVLVKMRGVGQKAAMTGLSRHNRKMLSMVGVNRLATIYNTPELALENVDQWI